MSLLCLLKGDLTCMSKPHESDPLVSVAGMFSMNFLQSCFGEHQFDACASFKKQMDQQTTAYETISSQDGFWSFIASKHKEAFVQKNKDLEEFVKLGIPPEYRSKMWLALAGLTITPQLISEYRVLAEKQSEDHEHDIQKDVDRAFEIQDPSFNSKLSRILHAYSNYNPHVGYCQSMNILAASLLIFMKEEYAFWMLVYLIQKLLPNYHTKCMSGYLAAAEVFKLLIAIELPELHRHFQIHQFDITALTVSWFLSLFVHTMPNITAFLIWDNIILKGTKAIFEVGLALLRMQHNEILQIHCFDQLMTHIRKRVKELYNPNKLLKHWKNLEAAEVQVAISAIKQMDVEIARAEKMITNRSENGFRFTPYELNNLWTSYVAEYPVLCCQDMGLNSHQFSQFVAGTFGEWSPDVQTVRHLFQMLDLNNDEVIDFPEIATFLHVISRGSFAEFNAFNARLFDITEKGWIDKADLTRILSAMYGMYSKDREFDNLIDHFVNDIFAFPIIAFNGIITGETFGTIVKVQPQILERFKKRNPNVKFHAKATYFYWMNLFEDSTLRAAETIQIIFDHQSQTEHGAQGPTRITFSAFSPE